MIDGYAHLGMPRFWAYADYAPVMKQMGIGKALICPFDSCPDLEECHRAITDNPSAFRAFGVALGRDREETERGILAQLAAGFEGLRLPDRKIVSDPWILDVLAHEGATPLVVGSNGLLQAAPALLKFLEQGAGRVVVSAHFAGPTDANVLQTPGPVHDLFSHPRFMVVCSRQGLFDSKMIEAWTQALIRVVGWTRMQWGSEAPIPYWRDEVLAKTPEWIKRFNPTASELEQFYRINAERLVFSRPARPVAPLRMPFDPFAYEVKIPAPMFPYGLSADTRIPGRLVQAWLQAGGEGRQPLSVFVSQLLDRALRASI